MFAEDQDALRKKGSTRILKKNTELLKKLIKQHGWPTYDLVGYTAARYAWIIVQHSDHDIKFQKECLVLIESAVKKKQASKEDFAYLIDRVLVNSKEKQLFGTQFYTKNGKHIPRPIQDEKNIEKRRKAMDMQSFKEYKQQWKIGYYKRAKKKNIKI